MASQQTQTPQQTGLNPQGGAVAGGLGSGTGAGLAGTAGLKPGMGAAGGIGGASMGGQPGLQQGQGGQQQLQGYGGGQGGYGMEPFQSLFTDPFYSGGLGMGMGGMMADPFRMLGGLGGGSDALGFPRLGGDLLAGPMGGLSLGGRMGGALTRLDIKESPREFVITADVPGVTKDNIKVEVDANNFLHLSTNRADQREDRGERGGWTYHRLERMSGSSYRTLKLPPNVDPNRIAANVENGVLNLVLPKTEAGGAGQQRKQIAIA